MYKKTLLFRESLVLSVYKLGIPNLLRNCGF